MRRMAPTCSLDCLFVCPDTLGVPDDRPIAHTRRSNQERSASTRLRLLDATVESLIDAGWSHTSTTEVVRRAGVSRGAQVHHFPTKEELVLAAVEHLMIRRHADFDATFRDLPAEHRSPLDAMRLLRDRCFGSSFEAWLELLVASRCHLSLHHRLVDMDERFFERSVQTYNDLFPELTGGDPQTARVGLELVFAVLDGMALRRMVGRDADDLDDALASFVLLTTQGLAPPITTPTLSVVDPHSEDAR